jgi:hypothetical protein
MDGEFLDCWLWLPRKNSEAQIARNVVLPLDGVLRVNIEANALMYKFTQDMIELFFYSVTINDSILSKPTHIISRVWVTRT